MRESSPAEEQGGGLAARQHLGGSLHGLFGHLRQRLARRRLSDAVGRAPGGVGGQDQGRDLSRRLARGRDREGAVACDRARVRRGLDPVRNRSRNAFDIGRERGVVAQVVGGVVTHDVDDAGASLLRVVQVRQAVGEARSQVQQGGGWLLQHPVVAIRGARHDAFEEAQDAAHPWDLVESRHEVHLGRAGIGETDVDTAREQRPHQAFRAVHLFAHAVAPRILGGPSGSPDVGGDYRTPSHRRQGPSASGTLALAAMQDAQRSGQDDARPAHEMSCGSAIV